MTVVTALPDLLGEAFERVQADIDSAFDAFLPVPDDTRARLIEAMRYAAIGGGKRVRPLLLVATADLFGVNRSAAINAGCAVEAIHAYSLIHDDLPCMDDDELRHGKPTVHTAFDEATAVLAGDCLHALAFDILSQMMDIMSEEQAYDLRQITRLQQLKTGALLAASVEMGAVLGRVPPEGRAHLRAYARDIGLAFQIADDLLDVEGDEERTGKTLRKDEVQGKQTFVTLMGVEQARAQATMLVEQAGRHLASHGEDARLLVELARFIVKRDH